MCITLSKSESISSTMSTVSTLLPLLERLRRLHEIIRQTVVEACERMSMESMAAIAREEEGDTTYAIDYLTEELLIDFFGREMAATPIVLIAEVLPAGKLGLPLGTAGAKAIWRILVDPSD